MKNALPHGKITQLLQQINFAAILESKMQQQNISPKRLSEDIGHSKSYLYRQMEHNNQTASLLMVLSTHLQCNLFEPYINLLPEEVRITQREKDLQAEINSLHKQIEDITKERDIYKSIAMK
ncbi:MAG: hypothetical protein ABJB05_14805 [Parafilimonas sp.]